MTAPTRELSPATSLDRDLQLRKRPIYMALLGAFLFITGLSWLLRDPGDIFITYFYPVFCVVMLVLLAWLWRLPAALPRLEVAIFLFGAVAVLSRLGWHMHGPDGIEAQFMALIGGHYWSVGVLIIAPFFIFERHALLVGSTVLLLSAVITLSGLLIQVPEFETTATLGLFLLRVHVFLMIYLLLGAIISGMRVQLRRAQSQMHILDSAAHTDALTGVANRRAGSKLLEAQCKLADRGLASLSALLIDIDAFKRINDEHGHEVGDQVLIAFAQRLRTQLRASDHLIRWGGEEFLILAPGADRADASALAERCRKTVADTAVAGQALTISIGVDQYIPLEGSDRLLARLDAALYEGKAGGGDRKVVG